MFNEFICPYCEGHMMIAGHIIFGATRKKDKKTGIILLNPKLGDYSRILHPGFNVTEGDDIDFYCPMCHKNLAASDVNEKLIHIIMLDDQGEKHDVFFSGIVGEHCTYKVTGKTIEKMGENSDIYLESFKNNKKYK